VPFFAGTHGLIGLDSIKLEEKGSIISTTKGAANFFPIATKKNILTTMQRHKRIKIQIRCDDAVSGEFKFTREKTE